MVRVPGGPYRLVVESCDKPEPFACYHPDDNYTAQVELRPFLIDRFPVTNAQFKRFLDASGYRPADPTNFLRHWIDGTYPSDKADHPVVYVSIDDARAYAAWAGKRLPTEPEWQCAAQGSDRRRWPWGNVYEPWRCNGEGPDTTPVQAFPDGASSYGCLDLCGNVWELTDDQYDDGHHYYLILKGGSFYRIDERGLDAHESIYARRWPMPRPAAGRYRTGFYRQGGAQPVTHHVRFLQMGAALDRGQTIGFRCVRDL
ncbi:MAG: SUMF1/EgtB/PvdO family nonheme iron enzyme [Chloroflexi bacterium]|nr:SUMF1/EgtB/PvdO family nonheme iron enzyme [Chloroflexota bacterium]